MTSQAAPVDQPTPVFFSYGFRPFFLGASIWAALAMGLWIAMLSGQMQLPVRFDPVSWHAHAFVFGYLCAVIAGFLLTAVPNWTNRAPLTGKPLAALFALWVMGRAAMLASEHVAAWLFVLLDCAMPLALAAYVLREIISGKNWRNLIILALLLMLVGGNGLFHLRAQSGVANGLGFRIMLATAMMMIAVIGGRVIPAFTRNWLTARGSVNLPTPAMAPYDKVALLGLAAAFVVWVGWPDADRLPLVFIAIGVLHLIRLLRWKGWLAHAEPMIWVMHLGYLCIPLGAILMGIWHQPGTQHLWMAGAIGIMTLVIMTRATLGHTGRKVEADAGTKLIYGSIISSVVLRPLAEIVGSDTATPLLMISGALWITAFSTFTIVYGRILLRRSC